MNSSFTTPVPFCSTIQWSRRCKCAYRIICAGKCVKFKTRNGILSKNPLRRLWTVHVEESIYLINNCVPTTRRSVNVLRHTHDAWLAFLSFSVPNFTYKQPQINLTFKWSRRKCVHDCFARTASALILDQLLPNFSLRNHFRLKTYLWYRNDSV